MNIPPPYNTLKKRLTKQHKITYVNLAHNYVHFPIGFCGLLVWMCMCVRV